MEGYKVFEPDWTCRGFHFCKELKDCFNYYPFNPDNKVAKVIALGEIDEELDDSKCCTNKIQIVEEISWEDVLRMVNLGKGNAGLWNSGDWNSGDWNSGNRNSGDWIWSDDMTDEEKEQHPEYEVVGGYLKILDESECGQLWWDSLSERYKDIIKAMPNFDKEIFEDVTGIKI